MDEHLLPVTRSARIVTLGPLSGTPAETWVALHGQGQLASRLARRFAPIDDGRRLIVVPEGLSRYYVKEATRLVGASWMTSEERLVEIADYVAYLDAVHAWLPEAARHAPRTVLGFSQGSATAWRWVTQGAAPPPSRLVIWGGEVPPDLDLDAARSRLADSTITFVAGTDDPYCPPDRLARYAEQIRGLGLTCTTRSFRGGHEILPEPLTALR